MLNQCNFIGRAGKDPELRYTPSGDAVATFSLAVSETWKGKDGQKNEKTTWVDVVMWRKLGEIAGQYVKKGDMLFISGKMQTRTYDDRDGNKRYVTEIVADQMKMLGGKPEGRTEKEHAPYAGGYENQEPEEDLPF